MAKSQRRRTQERRQLRGPELEDRIEAVIRQLAADAHQAGKAYVYNASEAARQTPTTTKTLRAHRKLVDRVLKDLEARRRMVTGDATREHLADQVAILKEDLAEKDRMIQALRAHHVMIYKRLHGYSMDGEALIRPILDQECDEAGVCLFCGTKPDSVEASKRPVNVITLKGSR